MSSFILLLLMALVSVANCWFSDALNNLLPKQHLFVTKPLLAHEREKMLPGITELSENAMSQFRAHMKKVKVDNELEYETFFDNFVENQISQLYIPSVAVAFVDLNNSANSFEKVYCGRHIGQCGSNVTAEEQVSETLFRIASISKSVTATAMMLLADEHKLNMSEPIIKYLKDKLSYAMSGATTYDATDITFDQLLTHTAGFDETIVGQIAQQDDFLSLVDYLTRVQPRRLYPNGVVPSYSNYGFSVIGLLIELISGQSYEQFVRERLFTPLAMNRSIISPRDPVAAGQDYWPRTAPQVTATNPISEDGPDLGNYIFQFVPAGQIMLTPADMSKYMRFHLRGGVTDDGKRLVSQANMDLMHGRRFFKDSPLGIGYGFIHTYVNSEISIEHDGDMPTASSRMMLLPDSQRAIFLSVGKGGMPTRDSMKSEFAAQFGKGSFPQHAEHTSSNAWPRPDGLYRSTRFAHFGCISLVMTLSQAMFQLNGNQDSATMILNDSPIPYSRIDDYTAVTNVEPFMFQSYPFLHVSKNNNGAPDGTARYVSVINPFLNLEVVESSEAQKVVIFVGFGIFFILLGGMCVCGSLCGCCGRRKRKTTVSPIMTGAAMTGADEDVPLIVGAKSVSKAEKAEKMTEICFVGIVPMVMFALFIGWIVAQVTITGTLPLGFPADSALLWAIPFIMTILTFLLAIMTVVSVAMKWWPIERRIALGICTLGYACIVVFFVQQHQYEQCWH